jgi:hypothetical protein
VEDSDEDIRAKGSRVGGHTGKLENGGNGSSDQVVWPIRGSHEVIATTSLLLSLTNIEMRGMDEMNTRSAVVLHWMVLLSYRQFQSTHVVQ